MEQLVQHIKDGQRSDPTFRDMWWKFCDSNCEGIRDPMRPAAAFSRIQPPWAQHKKYIVKLLQVKIVMKENSINASNAKINIHNG